MSTYEILVGGEGVVLITADEDLAIAHYYRWVETCRNPATSCHQQSVTLIADGDVLAEFDGEKEAE